MLRINQSSSAAAKSYYASASEYYGAGEQEMIGDWGGKSADRLSLSGQVAKQDFERICDNRHPLTGERLTARNRAGRRVGYDFNFHACKSVSLLYGLTDDPAILDAFRQSVAEVMRQMETGVKVRVRKRGQLGERTVGNMIWAEFLHYTARPVGGVIDPHLHGHYFVPNCCWDHVERMWKAIDVASVKEDAPQWQAMFQKSFGRRLAALGYGVVWKGDSFEIDGIGRETLERFSRRTNLVNRTAAERGITDARDKDRLGALTRERKRKNATMPQLRAEWRQRLTDSERAELAQAALRQRHSPSTSKAQTLPSNSRPDVTAWERERLDFIRQRQRRAGHAAEHRPMPAQRGGYGR
jgi:conjugative relaxase-like TrwC/TraI family protein